MRTLKRTIVTPLRFTYQFYWRMQSVGSCDWTEGTSLEMSQIIQRAASVDLRMMSTVMQHSSDTPAGRIDKCNWPENILLFQVLKIDRPAAPAERFQTRVKCNAAQCCRTFQSHRQTQRESRCNWPDIIFSLQLSQICRRAAPVSLRFVWIYNLWSGTSTHWLTQSVVRCVSLMNPPCRTAGTVRRVASASSIGPRMYGMGFFYKRALATV